MTNNTKYNDYLENNRKAINKTLNKLLWLCLFTAPSIAIGIFFGSFPEATYSTCFVIFLVTLVLAAVHTKLLDIWPDSIYTSFFILLALDILLVQMNYSRIDIQITWFFVPLLSILFCNIRIYLTAIIINYCFMAISIYLTAPYYIAMRSDYTDTKSYFLKIIGGYTIETFIMTVAGLVICKYIIRYLEHIFDENITIRNNQVQLENQLKIQESMARIYDTVNLIDFDTMKEKSLSDTDSSEYSIEGHAHTKMNHSIRKHVIPEQYDAFTEFTDITTIRDRLLGKRSIYEEFINVDTGWFRAQYIALEDNPDIPPQRVIYTTQTIDDAKRREEYLVRISTTDELTSLYNRRSYHNDIRRYKTERIEDDFVIISIDVNGLKEINDLKGHQAGDELIKGAADSILWAVCNVGKVYRTGGDEFVAVIHYESPKEILFKIRENAAKWHGNLVEELSLSIGYAAHRDYPEADVLELEKLADNRMYEDKSEYYKKSGKDRRTRTF